MTRGLRWITVSAGLSCACPRSDALPEAEIEALMDEARGGNHVFAVDLEAQTVSTPGGVVHRFEIDAQRKEKLLKGLDPIGETLVHAPEIASYEDRQRLTQPWAG